MRRPMMSGHCATPATDDPQSSHDRCGRNGGGNRANPRKEFQPCPCGCHLGEEYDCANCDGLLREAPLWEGDDPEEMVYVHVDAKTGRALGEECG